MVIDLKKYMNKIVVHEDYFEAEGGAGWRAITAALAPTGKVLGITPYVGTVIGASVSTAGYGEKLMLFIIESNSLKKFRCKQEFALLTRAPSQKTLSRSQW